jgi:hypothetical protein
MFLSTSITFPLCLARSADPAFGGIYATESLAKDRRERKGVFLILVLFISATRNPHRIFLIFFSTVRYSWDLREPLKDT